MKAFSVVGTSVLVLGGSTLAMAQPWPSKSITLVVPFPAGGPTDTLTRILTEPMRRFLGQTVLVDNTTGAGGSIGVRRVVRSAPDGYTASIGHWGTHVVNGAYYKLDYDLLQDLAPVAMFADNPQVMVSNVGVPAKTVKEVIAWIKGKPGELRFGAGSLGGSSHMAAIYFMNRIGEKTQYIAYRGGAPAMAALLSGEINLYMTQLASAVPQIRAGKIRGYMVTANKRQAAAPDIPSADEAGLPKFYTSVWHAMWVPKGTPQDAIKKLNAATVEALGDANVRKRFTELGQEIPSGEGLTPQALARHHKAEIDKWFPIIRDAGLKPK